VNKIGHMLQVLAVALVVLLQIHTKETSMQDLLAHQVVK